MTGPKVAKVARGAAFLAIALVSAGCVSVPPAHTGPSFPAPVPSVDVVGVCFAVKVGTDVGPVTSLVNGTLFTASGAMPRRIVLLLPGIQTPGTVWDGFSARQDPPNGTTLPRMLAIEGWAAITLDRIGLSRSPVQSPGAGVLIGLEEQTDATRQVIQAIQAGRIFRENGGTCNESADQSTAYPHVVVAGHSLATGIVYNLAAQREVSLAGVIIISGALNGNFSPALQQLFAECTSKHFDPTTGNTQYFCDDTTAGPSCQRWLAHVPTARQDAMRLHCADIAAETEPAGLVRDAVFGIAAGALAPSPPARAQDFIRQFQPIPAYWMMPQYDAIASEDEETFDEQATRFVKDCTCLGTAVVEPDIGHSYFVHEQVARIDGRIIEWLRSSGFGQ